MDRERAFAATARERRRIADLIDSLDEGQLATPSLCAGWDVKTVASQVPDNPQWEPFGHLRRHTARLLMTALISVGAWGIGERLALSCPHSAHILSYR